MTIRTEKQAHDLAAVGFALLEHRGFRVGASELGISDLVALHDAMKAHEAQAAMLAALPADKLQAARDAVAEAIGVDAYDCIRVWEAWGSGTMDENDFVPIIHDAERLEEITLAAIQAVAPAPLKRITHITQGGDYEYLGLGFGAGELKTMSPFHVYREPGKGMIFIRTGYDFGNRMRDLNPAERPLSSISEGDKPCPECGSRYCNGECMGDGEMGG